VEVPGNLRNLNAAEQDAIKVKQLDVQHRFPLVHLLLADIFHLRNDPEHALAEMREYLKLAPNATNVEAVSIRVQEEEKQIRQ
jgi:hypothetical protein